MPTIYRIEPDGTETVVACVDDPMEIGIAIMEDRDKIDYEAGYHPVLEADEPVAPAPFLLEGSDSE